MTVEVKRVRKGGKRVAAVEAGAGEGVRRTILVQGAREHNLRNVTVEIPREKLVVVTGLSGSGKSSLAFDTIYAEGQRRYMESLSTYARRFVSHIKKPDVDYMFGLSPVISIEQKTVGKNPRSTVGTMTDISSYLNLLFATASTAHCPYCREAMPIRTRQQIMEMLLALPEGTVVELRAPVWRVYGETLNFVLTEVRKRGYRRMLIDGTLVDLSDTVEEKEGEEEAGGDTRDDGRMMEVIVDRFTVPRGGEGIDKTVTAAVANALLVGDSFLKVELSKCPKTAAEAFYKAFGCPKHRMVVAELGPEFFMFNDPASACRTCMGLGTYRVVHHELLVPDPTRSIKGGCFVKEAYRYDPNAWGGRIMYSLSQHLKFSLDTPWQELPEKVREVVLNGMGGEKFPLMTPPGARALDPRHQRHIGKPWGFGGVAKWIERAYRRYRQKGAAHSGMENWLEKVMVEHQCPDCRGTRLKATRLGFTINGKSIHGVGQINFAELRDFLEGVKIAGRQKAAGQQVLKEIRSRLDLLLGIGLDYLNFNRRSGTLSGGESQRIRLSTQIGSGLMGMLYVLDEPSIGLHPKDNAKMIATLRRLRDLGNTVIVVEHDEDTIRAADYVVEMGPGPGVHGGAVVVAGKMDDVLKCRESPTGRYLSGREEIRMPALRRPASGRAIMVRGARENNLQNLTVEIPLQQFVCVTGASGSGKSTLINEVLYKAIWKAKVDSRVLTGAHDGIDGLEQLTSVVNIDQSPIGRTSRSNPATYIGFYDEIRHLFASTPEARKRGYNAGRFSFNLKSGRCAECGGEGTITTQLYFMPDVEVPCEVCKGARYNAATLEVTYKGKTIADVLNMSVEEGELFFEDHPGIAKKIRVLNELGLGYLTLGQSSTTLSGGEAQRVKLAFELSKMRKGEHILYILDEPTTGLHLADIAKLLECLNRLVDGGHTVLVIEHHLDVIKTADHIIDLGPEGGHSGGQVVFSGTPEEIVRCRGSHTGRYLRGHVGEE